MTHSRSIDEVAAKERQLNELNHAEYFIVLDAIKKILSNKWWKRNNLGTEE